MHLSGVLLGVDGHGSNPQFGAGSEHTDGDFTWKKRGSDERMVQEELVILLIYQSVFGFACQFPFSPFLPKCCSSSPSLLFSLLFKCLFIFVGRLCVAGGCSSFIIYFS